MSKRWSQKLLSNRMSAGALLLLVSLSVSAMVGGLAVFGSPALFKPRPHASPAIQTDKTAYLAKEAIEISGSGFAPLELVMLQVKHTGGTTENGTGHEAWFINADRDGSFTSTWTINSNDDAGVNLVLTAAGSSSSTAQAEFARVAAISTSLRSYKPGDTVQVNASGFNPNQLVTIQVNNQDAFTTQTDQNGQATGSLKIPEGSNPGTFSLRAIAPESGLISSSVVVDAGQAALSALSTALGTFFQLDADASSAYPVVLATGHDWSQVYADSQGNNPKISGTAAINFYTDSIGLPGGPTEDTFTGGNTKDVFDIGQWTYDSSAPQNKADLEHAIAAAYIDPSNNHTYLYVGADRYDNSGSIALGAWFLQSPIVQSNGKFYTANANGTPNLNSPAHHVNGDLLLVADFNSGSATITSFTWNNGAIPATGTTLSTTIGTAVVNTTALDGASGHAPQVPWPFRSSAKGGAANFVQAGEFFEAGVDLNLLFPGQTNFNFSSFMVETRASTSPTATLSDFIIGHVSTAPDVTVTKVADNATVDAGGPVGYTVTVANVGVGDILNATLNDPLPPGSNNIAWSIVPGGNPNFVLSGATGSQTLSLTPGLLLANATSISVHIIGVSSSNDRTLVNTATVGAGNEDSAFGGNNVASATITLNGSGVSTVNPQYSVEGASHLFAMGSFISANIGTASVDVNWGDGAPHTTFTFVNTPTLAYAMPSQTHTYAEEGTYTVTESVTLGGAIKSGTFSAIVSDPPVVAAGVSPITKTYDGLIVGAKNLATFTDPGGAEPNSASNYTATVDWGGSFGTTSATISFAGALGSTTGVFTVTAPVPYQDFGSYSPTVTINHEASTPQTVTDTVTINRAPLTITADFDTNTAAVNAFSKVYDGNVYSPFTVRYSGFVNSETSAVLGGTLGFSGAGATAFAAGGPYTVTPGGQTSSNYNITFVDGSLNISRAPLTITADAAPATVLVDPFTKEYDGHAFAGFTVRYDGFVNNETSAVLGGTISFTGAGASAVNAGGPYPVTPGGQTSSNYDITHVNGSLNIAQKLLIVTANNDSFNEGSNPNSLTASYSGFVPGETLATSGVSGAPSLTTAATSTSAPGTSYLFTVGAGTLQAVNYYFQTQNGSLTVVDVAPTILMSIGPITLNLGDGFTRPGAFTDPGSVVLPLLTETWTITVDYGDGTAPVTTTATTPGSFPIDHVYGSVSGVNPYTVTIKIGDNFGASSTKTFTVTVNVP